jgi:hypothetical protein
MPQPILDRLPRPICGNCDYYEAMNECGVCKEYFCETCWLSVHYGGKRRLHDFRSLYDFYGLRIDYGDGEWPSKWPSEIEQDDVNGWFEKDKGKRNAFTAVSTKDGENLWGKFYDAERGIDVYFNKKTGEQQDYHPDGLDDNIIEKQSPSLSENNNNNWVKYKDEISGLYFYFNAITNQSVYERPNGFITPRETSEVPAPVGDNGGGWTKYWDDEGNYGKTTNYLFQTVVIFYKILLKILEFYYNEFTNVSSKYHFCDNYFSKFITNTKNY